MNAAEMGKYCTSLFVNDTDEKLYLISLNIHGQLLGSSLICSGSLDELVIYPRNVVNAALRSRAYAVVLTHNHPGGSLRPSPADISTTMSIRDAMNAIDVTLLDHIIVGRGRYASMAAQGCMDYGARTNPNHLMATYMDYLNSDDTLPSQGDERAAESGGNARRPKR